MTDHKINGRSPEETLKAASRKIRETIQRTTPGPWRYELETRRVRFDPTTVATNLDPYEGKHMALWDPPMAEMVAKLFDRWAWMVRLDDDLIHRIGGDETLALARAVLGEQEETERSHAK